MTPTVAPGQRDANEETQIRQPGQLYFLKQEYASSVKSVAQLERIREFFLLSLKQPQPGADSFDANNDSRPVGAMD